MLVLNNASLLKQNETSEDDTPDPSQTILQLQAYLPPQILARASALTMTPTPPEILQPINLQTLYYYLPSSEIANRLRNIYYKHAAWMYVCSSATTLSY